jgi:hypothetical protein
MTNAGLITFPERPECAEHRARIGGLENDLKEEKANRKETDNKLDNLKTWVMSTLVAAVGGLLAAVGAMALEIAQHK